MYWITGVLGALLAVLPFVFGLTSDTMALGTGVVLGGITVALSIIKGSTEDRNLWEYWVMGIAGILALVAPFVLSFTAITLAVWMMSGLGGALVALSGYEVFTRHVSIGGPHLQQPA